MTDEIEPVEETEEEPTLTPINAAIYAIMDIVDAMDNYADITRGALGSAPGIACEIAPSRPMSVYMDKNTLTDIDLTFNAKHGDLKTVSDTLNNIYDTLTRATSYPSGNGWEIVDISGGSIPSVIGREDDNSWLMAASVTVKFYRKDEEIGSELG